MSPHESPLARRNTRRSPLPTALRGLGCVGLFALLAGACSLDWTVRADPGDAGVDVIATDGTTARDAPLDAPEDTAVDALPEDAGPCETLAADVVRTRAKAKECTLGAGGQCTTTVQDECDCPVVVRIAGSAASTDYANAVAALVATCGKPAACGACPQLGLPVSWACLQPAGVVRCTP